MLNPNNPNNPMPSQVAQNLREGGLEDKMEGLSGEEEPEDEGLGASWDSSPVFATQGQMIWQMLEKDEIDTDELEEVSKRIVETEVNR